MARIASWAMLALAVLGLLYTAAATTLARMAGIALLIVGVMGGIAGAFVAIHSKAKQTAHEDRIGAELLGTFGQELRRGHNQNRSRTAQRK